MKLICFINEITVAEYENILIIYKDECFKVCIASIEFQVPIG